MKLAEKFGRAVIAFIDTPAAVPRRRVRRARHRRSDCLQPARDGGLNAPIIVIVHGEGGSGGALGIAIGDRILMHEFAIYSVIPPEGCAAILWRDAGRKVEAAEALRLTAPDLEKFGVIDEIVREPVGGAHTDHERAATLLDAALERALAEVWGMSRRNGSMRGTTNFEPWEYRNQ
jgi:acetyl-CoA carboxylase carboxyl transferase subunit alpha